MCFCDAKLLLLHSRGLCIGRISRLKSMICLCFFQYHKHIYVSKTMPCNQRVLDVPAIQCACHLRAPHRETPRDPGAPSVEQCTGLNQEETLAHLKNLGPVQFSEAIIPYHTYHISETISWSNVTFLSQFVQRTFRKWVKYILSFFFSFSSHILHLQV